MKKFGLFSVALLSGALLIAASSCGGFFDPPKADKASTYEWALGEGYEGTEGEWLSSSAAPQTMYRRLFEEARADGSFGGSYFDFLEQLGVSDDTAGLQRSLLSAVSIEATFAGSSSYSAGSGVVYSADRSSGDLLIITNYHVVYNPDVMRPMAQTISAWLYGGETEEKKLEATFLAGALQYDLAILSVEGDDIVTETAGSARTGQHTNADVVRESSVLPATWGDSDGLTVSERVYAIGNPLGYGLSLTSGVVSRDAEYIDILRPDEREYVSMLEIRTDAAVNHGNSGGGLFNRLGELVGIVNARSEAEGLDDMGYAIPVSVAKPLIENILDNGSGAHVARAGFTVTGVGKSVFDETTGKTYIEENVVVDSVSGASSSGLQVGDVVRSAAIMRGGNAVRSITATRRHYVENLFLEVRSGDTVVLLVSRENTTYRIELSFTGSSAFRDFR